MSRATVCFSMYSLMSMRIIAFSSSNRNSASARAVSVLPTPVGPRKMNEPMGRFGSCNPLRERRTALDTALMASFWPMTRCSSRSSILTSFSRSPSSIRDTGMCVHAATTWAMSSSVTSWRSKRWPAGCLRSDCFSIVGQLLLQFGNLAVLNLRRLGSNRRCAAPVPVRSSPAPIWRLHDADGVDGRLLILPLRLERLGFVLQVGECPSQSS